MPGGPRRVSFREKLLSRPCSQICALLLSRCQLTAYKTRFCSATFRAFARFSGRLSSLARSSAVPCSRAKDSGNAEDYLQPDALESLALAVPLRLLPAIVMASALPSLRPGCRLASGFILQPLLQLDNLGFWRRRRGCDCRPRFQGCKPSNQIMCAFQYAIYCDSSEGPVFGSVPSTTNENT
jgi:hypothetical protein